MGLPGPRHRCATRGSSGTALRAHRSRGSQPHRLQVGLHGGPAGDHGCRPGRWCAGAMGPVPFRGRSRARARRRERRPCRRLHIQVPQRRTRIPGVRVRRGGTPVRPRPTDPRLDGRCRPLRDGPVVPARGGYPPLHQRHAAHSRHDPAPRHARSAQQWVCAPASRHSARASPNWRPRWPTCVSCSTPARHAIRDPWPGAR